MNSYRDLTGTFKMTAPMWRMLGAEPDRAAPFHRFSAWNNTFQALRRRGLVILLSGAGRLRRHRITAKGKRALIGRWG